MRFAKFCDLGKGIDLRVRYLFLYGERNHLNALAFVLLPDLFF
jgi:hypothetical protein